MSARSVLSALSLTAVAALSSQSLVAAPLEGSVVIDGSSTVYPITEAIAEEFLREQPKVKVKVGMSGTGGGFKKLAAGEIAMAGASRPIKDNEAKAMTDAKLEFIELPIAYDGLAVVINPKNTFVKSMTKAQLKKLWEPGSTVKTWKDLDPSWPANAIKLYGPGPNSGTFDYFTEEVVGKSKASRSDFTASEDDNVLVNGVAGDVNALGYFGHSYYNENKTKVKAIAIDAGKGALEPSDQNIESGNYALSRPLFVYVSKQAAAKPEVDAFVKFYMATVKDMSREVGYLPLQQSIYDEATKAYDAKKTGRWSFTKAAE